MTLTILEHDRAVRHYALLMVAQGYQVFARIEGWFEEPQAIAGYRPDIIAIKGNRSVVLEIKKGEIDWPKIRALEAWVDRCPDCEFRLVSPGDIPQEMLDNNARQSA